MPAVTCHTMDYQGAFLLGLMKRIYNCMFENPILPIYLFIFQNFVAQKFLVWYSNCNAVKPVIF